MSGPVWGGALGIPQMPFRRVFKRLSRPVPDDAEIVTAYTDGQVTLRSGRAKVGYHEAADLSGYQGVEVGDFVVHGLDIMRGSVGVSDSAGAMSSVCAVCQPTSLIDPHFAAYAIRLQAASGYPKALARGVREGGADFRRWDTLAELPVPVPPIDRQRDVVAFLRVETTEIDAFIADQEELVGLLAERRAATISHAVTKGLDPSIPMKDSGVDAIGAVPNDWQVGPLRRLRPSCEPGTSVNSYPFPRGLGEIGVLKTGSVSKGYFDSSENKQVTDQDLWRVTGPLRRGSLLVNRANSPELVGAGALVFGDTSGLFLSDKLWQLNFESAWNSFLYYWTQTSYYRGQIQSSSVGASSSMQNLSYSDFLSLAVACPAVPEQQQIAEYLDRETAELDAAIADAREAIALSRERRTALISAAVTGKIDVRGSV